MCAASVSHRSQIFLCFNNSLNLTSKSFLLYISTLFDFMDEEMALVLQHMKCGNKTIKFTVTETFNVYKCCIWACWLLELSANSYFILIMWVSTCVYIISLLMNRHGTVAFTAVTEENIAAHWVSWGINQATGELIINNTILEFW